MIKLGRSVCDDVFDYFLAIVVEIKKCCRLLHAVLLYVHLANKSVRKL